MPSAIATPTTTEFHITYAYPNAWIEPEALAGWQTLLDQVLADVRRQAPILELRAPAFCSFEDMNWFEELLSLENAERAKTASAYGTASEAIWL